MLKFFYGLAIINNVFAEDALHMVGGARSENNCLVGAGYTWCKSSNSCIRSWVTPCEDNYSDCNDCLEKQRSGINIACPDQCDYISMPPPPPPMPPPPMPHPPTPPVYYPTDPLPIRPAPICPEVMCMMYCQNGHKIDTNGCQMCQCNDEIPAVNMEPQIDDCPLIQPPCDGHRYVCPKLTEITHCNEGGIKGHTTYQLSLVIKDNMNIKNIYAIYGNGIPGKSMHLPAAYQSSVNQGQNIGGVSEYMISVFPETEFDSWLTIGLTDGDPSSLISAIGVDFDSWSDNHGLDITNGAIFLMDPVDIDLDGQGNEIVVAQLTIPTHITSSAIINVQGKTLSYNIRDVDSESWTEDNIVFELIPPNNMDTTTVPVTCQSWYDGCNTCSAHNGVLGSCSRMMCFTEDTPRCLQYVPGH